MALPKKKGFAIKFDLSLGGLLGVGVVCFCIFLWMFLLGVWAGQTGLISGISLTAPMVAPVTGKGEEPKRPGPKGPVVTPEREPEAESPPAPAPVAAPAVPLPVPAAPVVAPSASPEKTDAAEAPRAKAPAVPFYAIQVGAFRDSQNVADELRVWRARGYEPFSRPPGENEHLTKVYVGHYLDATAARKEEAILAKKRKISPLIVMIRPD